MWSVGVVRVSAGLYARGGDAGVQLRLQLRLQCVSGRCSFTLPRHCPSWKIKECPRRVGVRSSLLSPRSRLSKLGARAQSG